MTLDHPHGQSASRRDPQLVARSIIDEGNLLPSAGELLLTRLLDEVRACHGKYIRLVEQVRWWQLMCVMGLCIAPILGLLGYWLDGSEVFTRWPVLIFALGYPAVALVVHMNKRRVFRHRLQDLKIQLNRIGYVMAYDASDPYAVRLVLAPRETVDPDTVLASRRAPLDFDEYDRRFIYG